MKRSSEPSSARWMTTGWCSSLSAPTYVRPKRDGHLVVELDRAHLPGAAERVGHVQVDLRAVEGALALADRVLEVVALRAPARARPRRGPTARRCRARCRAASTARRAGRARRGRRGSGRSRPCAAISSWIWSSRDEDVRVVLRDVLDAQQAVQRPALLVAVQRRRLGEAQRQLAVAAQRARRRGACGRGSSSA